jgi:4-alpha-glucanotransferase
MRQSGILLAVSSLPSQYGIGDFGNEAYQFIDLLKEAGMQWWQVLPLNPLGYGNSPYQPYSSQAMDELYISLDRLKKQGLIQSHLKRFQATAQRVDYDAVRVFKSVYLKEAFLNFKPNLAYQTFIAENSWVETYAIFMTFKSLHQLNMWTLWDKEFKEWITYQNLDLAPYQKDINYHMFLQYVLFEQYMGIKHYANQQGILMVGDIPIYVGIDSIDVWTNQKQFLLTDSGEPTHIAGVPPDYFSATGQRWGNPLYRWDVMEADGFSFWINRLGYNQKLFDIIRIDHFRAFDTYWKIPSSCPTAVEGAWIEAPGYALFDQIYAQFPHIQIIAEDLGDLRPQVLELRDHYQLPGMKITQFSLPIYQDDSESINPESPKYDGPRSIVYTGTHDNQTTIGWYQTLSKKAQEKLEQLLATYTGTIAEKLVQFTLDSVYQTAVIPMQDLLNLDDSARMNVPGTIGSPNWEWKMNNFTLFQSRIPLIKEWLKKANR